MLFNSLEFIFVFLPAFLLAYHFGRRLGRGAFLAVIVVFSLGFYSWWYLPNIFVLLASIGFNYLVSPLIAPRPGAPAWRRLALIAAITANLGWIFYFKYVDAVVASLNEVLGLSIGPPGVILPLAISFFTFQQISYLIDLYNGRFEKPPFLLYCAYVCFFPQLIAGPIVRFSELAPQFEACQREPFRFERRAVVDLGVGLAIFAMGLAKKVVLADTLASFTDPMYAAVVAGEGLTLFEAWVAIVAFGFQIYFDFSGYSDMAVGLARMAGFRLPINFNSPYKAGNISELWRRWHMTLTRFFTDYAYSPIALAATRKAALSGLRGLPAELLSVGLPVMITFVLIGMWHGPGWKWILFGALNGAFLLIHRSWAALCKKSGLAKLRLGPFGGFLGQFLTIAAFFLGLVLFRAESLDVAARIYWIAFGGEGLVLAESVARKLGPVSAALLGMGFEFGPAPYWQGTRHWVWLILAAVVALFLPNSYQLTWRYAPILARATHIKEVVQARLSHLGASGRLWVWVSRLAVALLIACWVVIFFQDHPDFQAWVPTSLTFGCAGLAFLILLLLPRVDLAWRWRPDLRSAIYTALLFVVPLVLMATGGDKVFIYFDF